MVQGTNLAGQNQNVLPAQYNHSQIIYASYDLLSYALGECWDQWDDTEDEIELDRVIASRPIRYAQWAYRVEDQVVFISGSYIPSEDGETDSVEWSLNTASVELAEDFFDQIENVT